MGLFEAGWLNVTVSLLAGGLAWTLLEYVLHRWAGHAPKGRTKLSREHLAHHAKTDYFSPALGKLALAVPVVSLAAWLGGLPFGAGLAAAWFGYEMVHRRVHTHGPLSAYSRWACRHHLHHHFASPNMNHGVSTPIWDWVFRTYERPAVRLRVPKVQATRLKWLDESVVGYQIA